MGTSVTEVAKTTLLQIQLTFSKPFLTWTLYSICCWFLLIFSWTFSFFPPMKSLVLIALSVPRPFGLSVPSCHLISSRISAPQDSGLLPLLFFLRPTFEWLHPLTWSQLALQTANFQSHTFSAHLSSEFLIQSPPPNICWLSSKRLQTQHVQNQTPNHAPPPQPSAFFPGDLYLF